MTAARYAPDQLLPPYSYVTGMHPHPLREPTGHSFGRHPSPPDLPAGDSWRNSPEYLFAIDLWNAGYYWEAHEAWEGLWHAAGGRGATADFFKGLIKTAAAGVKLREGRPHGAQRHLARAAELFEIVATGLPSAASFWGLRLESLQQLCARLAALPYETAMSRAAPVVRVWEELLLPE